MTFRQTGNDTPIYAYTDARYIDSFGDTVGASGFNATTGNTEFYNYPIVQFEYSAAVPEPATMFLIGSGLVGLAGFRKTFRKR